MQKVGIICILLLCLSAMLTADTIAINSNSDDLALINSSATEIQFKYGFNGIDITNLSNDDRNFNQLIIPESIIDGKIGEPGLPVRKKLIEIPWGADYSIKITNYKTRRISLENRNKIYPVQPSIAKNVDIADVPFEMNESLYRTDAFTSSELVSLQEVGVMRGIRVARLVINPVQYNPVMNMIEVKYDIEFSIELSGSDMALTEYNKDKAYSPYYEIVYNRVNRTYPDHDYPSNPDMRRYPIKYLIVANRMFENTLQQFIEWKTKKGFEVIVGYTDTIGSSSSAIKSWLQGHYDAGTPSDPAPSFALIVGDVAQVTNYGTGSSSAKGTDLYYYCYDGGSDYVPDMYYGRWSVTSTTELQNIIDKTLYYEQYQFATPSYLDNVTLIAGVDGTWNPRVGQATIQYGMNQYFNSAHGFANVYDYLTSYSGCFDTMDSGVGFINYTAHGSTTSWADPSFSTSDISGMTNSGKPTFAIGNCCVTGQYTEVGTCFAEQFIRSEDKGAYAYIGSAPNTYWFEDFYWSVGAFPISGTNDGYVPSYSETTWGAYDGAFMTDYVTTDATKFLGNLAVTEVHAQNFENHSSDIYYWQAYMTFGDPSVVPYWTQGTTNNYTTNPFIPIGASTFTVNAEAGSYVAISQNGVLHGAALVGSTGTVDVPITAFTGTGTADLVITRPQRQPVITTLPIQPLSGPYVSIESVTVNAGGDDVISNGEIVYLTLQLENVGTSTSTSTYLTVSESDSYITLTDNNQSFGTIASGATANASNCIAFTVSSSCPNDHPIVLNTTITGSGETWESTINLTAYAPEISIESVTVNDGANGNLDPNETANLNVTVTNTGGAIATNFNYTLSTTYGNITINDNQETTSVATGSSSVLTFPITVSSAAQVGDTATFNLAMSGTGYANSENFSLAIGIIAEDFETGDFNSYSWMMGGDGDWTIATSAYEGTYSAQSGSIDHSETSELSIDMDVTSADDITFYYSVSSESGYDYLRFYIDGVEQGEWAGTVAWTQASYPVTTGNHTFKWAYEKDGSVSNNSDCAWIDSIVFPPCQIVVPEPNISLSPTSLDYGNVAVGATAEDVFTISNTGTSTLSGSIVTPSSYSVQEVTSRSKEHLIAKTRRNTINYTVDAGATKDFRVVFAPTALLCYNFDITINSNDLDTPVTLLPVSGCGSSIEASINPTSMSGNMNINQTATRNMTLSNNGNIDMTYSVSLTDPARTTGGPDTFGYTWSDSNESGGPVFNWITPSTTNEITSLGDDSAGTATPIGFNFPFYGTDYSDVYVNSNGVITFGEGSSSYSNSTLPNSSAPNNLIAWFWDDMNPADSDFTGHIYYQNGTVNSTNAFIITFLDYMEYGGSATPGDCVQAQVILFENGNIKIQYDYVGTSIDLTSESIGIENADGTDGLQVAYNSDGVTITDGYAVEFNIASSTTEWITIAPLSGTVSGGSSETLVVNLDTTDLEAGVYEKNIEIATNDPDNPVLTVPVSINVGMSSDPGFSVDVNNLDFGDVMVGNTGTEVITITNTGGATLTGAITTPYAYTVSVHSRDNGILSSKEKESIFQASKTMNLRNSLNYSINAGQSQSFDIDFTPVNPIVYNGNITISSNDTDNTSTYIPVTGTGVVADIDVTPTSVSVETSVETTLDRTVQISNTGNYDLNYSVSLEDPSRGSGGPDTYGYSWIDSNEAGGPSYNWIDIASTGTALTLGDDDSEEVTLPFTFNFYGNDYSSIFVGSNGLLNFGSGSTVYSDVDIPNTNAPNNMICPLWDDLKPTGAEWGNVYTQEVNGEFVVQYEAVSHYNGSTVTDPVTFEVIFNSNGSIKFQYESVGTETDHHIGIENSDGTDGLQVASSGYAQDGLAVLIQSTVSNPWISCSSTGGTLTGGASTNITLTFDSNGLSHGTYNKNLVITSNDPDEGSIVVPCTLIYSTSAVPTISISETSFDFGAVAVGSSANETITITNTGGGTLTGSITTPSGYNAAIVSKLSLRNSLNFNLTTGASVMYDITFTPTTQSTYNGNIVVTSNDSSAPSINVAVTGSGYLPADIDVNPTSFSFTAAPDVTDSQTLTISNMGGQDLTYTVAPEASSGELLNESFDSGLPTSWTVDNGGDASHTWNNITDYSGDSIDTTNFMFIDSDDAGSGVAFDDALVSPVVPCASAQNLLLEFDQYFRFYSSGGDEKADVDVWDGSAWQNVLTMTSQTHGSWTAPDHQNIDITAYANAGLQVRFRYYDADYDWFWAVDNVTITATGGSSSWLTVDASSSVSGTVLANGNDQIAVQVNTAGLTEGDYSKDIIITSNDPDENTITVPVTLTVTGAQNDPSWDEQVVVYPNNTATIYCEVNIDGIPASTGDEIGAFVNGECRGYGEITLITRDNAYATLLIQASGPSEVVNFQIYDASNDEVYDVEDTCEITPGVVIGDAVEPEVLNAVTTIPSPQDLAISINGDQLTLSWTAIPSATGYNVYVSDTNDFTGITAIPVATNSWTGSSTDRYKFFMVTAVKGQATR